MKVNRVLILCPPPSERGGVANYYSLVKKYFDSEDLHLSFYYIGKKGVEKGFFKRIFRCLADLLAVLRVLDRYELFVLNPSLDPKAVIRDGIFHLFIKRIYRKKTIVFFRGWNQAFEQQIERKFKKLFLYVFNANKIIVLSKNIKEKLVAWGVSTQYILLETTTYKVFPTKTYKRPERVVYLSRFSEGKGCFEAIKSVEELIPAYPSIELYMLGDGPLTTNLKQYVSKHKLTKNVVFAGWVVGGEKYRILESSTIMLYPTVYGEGMPNSLLEGMGSGLAIVSRPVAGIADIIQNGHNGYLIDSIEPAEFAAKIKYLLEHRDELETISKNNRRIAKNKYEIKSVVKRLNNLYIDTISAN